MSKKINFQEAVERSQNIRKLYHELEEKIHGSKWSVEEDALAFLTDAGLVGRHTMSQQQRYLPGKILSQNWSTNLRIHLVVNCSCSKNGYRYRRGS